MPCTINTCTRVFTNLKAYTNHTYGDHLSWPRATSTNHHGNLSTTFEMVEHQMTEEDEQDLETDMET